MLKTFTVEWHKSTLHSVDGDVRDEAERDECVGRDFGDLGDAIRWAYGQAANALLDVYVPEDGDATITRDVYEVRGFSWDEGEGEWAVFTPGGFTGRGDLPLVEVDALDLHPAARRAWDRAHRSSHAPGYLTLELCEELGGSWEEADYILAAGPGLD